MKTKLILTPVLVAAFSPAAWSQLAPAPAAPAKPPIVAASPAGAPAPAHVPAAPAILPPGVVDAGGGAPQPGAAEPAPDGTLWVGAIRGASVVARGGATIFSHPVFKFEKGETVFILEELNSKTPKAGEPKQWLRVQVPANVGLWVHGKFLAAGPNAQTMVVGGNKLNVRAGHGENFPILCTLVKGDQVLVTPRKVNEWQEIVAPQNASVFVAADLVVKQAAGAGTVVSNIVSLPDPTLSKVLPKTVPTAPGTAGAAAKTGRKAPPPTDTIISVPKEAFDPTRKSTDSPEAFPAPPIPIKVNPPAGLKDPKTGVAPSPTKVGETQNKIEPTKIAGTPAATPAVTPAPAPATTPKSTEPAKVASEPASKPALPVEPAKTASPAPAATPTPTPAAPAGTAATPKPAEPVKPATTVTVTVPAPAAAPASAAVEPAPVRIVHREGVVQRTLNIQAAAPFVLEHLESGKVINYLLLDNPKLQLSMLRGRRVLVSGEEAIDSRWPDTPVLKIKSLKTTDDLEP